MKLPRRNFLHLAAGAAALSAVSDVARAQSYPTRPITIVVPFPAQLTRSRAFWPSIGEVSGCYTKFTSIAA